MKCATNAIQLADEEQADSGCYNTDLAMRAMGRPSASFVRLFRWPSCHFVDVVRKKMKNESEWYRFTGDLKRITDFLYQEENLNHPDSGYQNYTSGMGVFEDRRDGSIIYLEFKQPELAEVTEIRFKKSDGDGIVSHWIELFQKEFGAGIKRIG